MESLESILARRITGSAAAFSLHYADCLPSTNQTLRTWADAGAPAGTVCLAGQQTAGRGRQGRSFFSPPHAGLYLSLLLRPQMPPQDALLLTPMAAVAVLQAVEDVSGVRPSIKWVNDVLRNGRKLAGILTEAQMTPDGSRLSYVIVGIGCNLYPPLDGFPPELAAIAGSVWDSRPADPMAGWMVFAAALLQRLAEALDGFSQRTFFAPYCENLCMLHRPILVCDGQTERPATALAVDEQLRLLVRYTDGTEEWRSSGEIRIRAQSYRP